MSGWLRAEQGTMLDLLDARLESDGNGPFLDCCGTPYTAAEIDREANRIANALAGLGIDHGTTVATILENGPEAVMCWFAVHKLGAIAVPVNTALKGPMLRHQLADSGAPVVIVQNDLADRPAEVLEALPALRHLVLVGEWRTLVPCGSLVRLHNFSELLQADDARRAVRVRPADLATIIYTGGTTGPSKGCAISHDYHLSVARQITSVWSRTAQDVVWTPLPLFHNNAISIVLAGTLIAGGRAALARRFSVSGFWPEINRTGATIASLLGSPAVLVARAPEHPQARLSGTAEANTTLRMVSGAPVPPDIEEVHRTRFEVATFSNAYGTTGASLMSWLPPGRPGRAGSAGIINRETLRCRSARPARSCAGRGWRTSCTRILAAARGDGRRLAQPVVSQRRHGPGRPGTDTCSSWAAKAEYLRRVHAVPRDVGEDDVKVTVVLKDDATMTEEQLCRWSVDHLPYYAVPRYFEFPAGLPLSPTGRAPKFLLRDEGVTPATWDREAVGVTFERR